MTLTGKSKASPGQGCWDALGPGPPPSTESPAQLPGWLVTPESWCRAARAQAVPWSPGLGKRLLTPHFPPGMTGGSREQSSHIPSSRVLRV